MRAEYLGAFAHVLHLSPADVDALTLEDFDELRAFVDAYRREIERANASAAG